MSSWSNANQLTRFEREKKPKSKEGKRRLEDEELAVSISLDLRRGVYGPPFSHDSVDGPDKHTHNCTSRRSMRLDRKVSTRLFFSSRLLPLHQLIPPFSILIAFPETFRIAIWCVLLPEHYRCIKDSEISVSNLLQKRQPVLYRRFYGEESLNCRIMSFYPHVKLKIDLSNFTRQKFQAHFKHKIAINFSNIFNFLIIRKYKIHILRCKY